MPDKRMRKAKLARKSRFASPIIAKLDERFDVVASVEMVEAVGPGILGRLSCRYQPLARPRRPRGACS
jgi:cyclopropane fatty-acyl-phospholipid synthase-like methyltransferase